MSTKPPADDRGLPENDTLTLVKRNFFLTFTAIGVIVLIAGAVWVLGQVWTPISIILFSAFLVFILRTPVAWLETKGVSRGIGTAIMYVVTLMVLAAIGLVFVPVAIEQIVSFLANVPQYIQQAGNFITQTFAVVDEYLKETGVGDLLASFTGELAKHASTLATSSASSLVDAASTLGTVIVVAGISTVVGFWVLKDLPKFRGDLHRLVGPRYTEDVSVIGSAISRSLGGYLRGMVVACLVTGTLVFIAYTALGLQYPLVLALFTGLMVFVPFIGPILAWVLAGLVGLLISPLTAVLAAVLTIVSQIAYDYLVAPRVMGGSVQLHPAVILVAVFTGAAIGGIFGMLCAIPLTSAVKSIFVYYFEKRTQRQIVSEKGAVFMGHPAKELDPKADAVEGHGNQNPASGFFLSGLIRRILSAGSNSSSSPAGTAPEDTPPAPEDTPSAADEGPTGGKAE